MPRAATACSGPAVPFGVTLPVSPTALGKPREGCWAPSQRCCPLAQSSLHRPRSAVRLCPQERNACTGPHPAHPLAPSFNARSGHCVTHLTVSMREHPGHTREKMPSRLTFAPSEPQDWETQTTSFNCPHGHAPASKASTQHLQGFPPGPEGDTLPKCSQLVCGQLRCDSTGYCYKWYVRPFRGCLPTGISCGTAQRAEPQQMSDAATVASKQGNKGAGKTTQRRLCRLGFLRGHSRLPNPVPAVSSVTPIHETRPGLLACLSHIPWHCT